MDPKASELLTVTVQVSQEERAAFLQLVADFNAGRVRARAPALDLQRRSYRQLVAQLVSDRSTSVVLRERVIEDDGRDAAETLADAEMLQLLQSKRFAEAAAVDVVVSQSGLEEAGIEALRRLVNVANGRSGQCRYIAHFLLGLYNGSRFPFDLTDLRAIDEALFDDCMAVLQMDARLTRREVHNYIEDGERKWEDMARAWAVPNIDAIRQAAERLASRVGTQGPLAPDAMELLRLLEGGVGE